MDLQVSMPRPSPRVEDTSFIFDPPGDAADLGPREMSFVSVPPRGPLADCVAGYWFYRCRVTATRERILPTGTVGLVVDLEAGCGPQALGPQAQASVGQTLGNTRLVGVQFHPGCAGPFLGVPASQLLGASAPLRDLWGAQAEALHERLLADPEPAAMFRALEASLVARGGRELRPAPAVARAVAALNRPEGAPPVARLAESLGLTSRRLIRAFRDEVGLAPKLYARIRRFQQAVGLAVRNERASWALIAAACGCCDQAHLVHEFREFAGFTPTEFRELWSRHLAYAAC